MMQVDSLLNYSDDAYKALASAIVLQACKDYRTGKISYSKFKHFLRSQWYRMLTNVDGEYLLERLVKDDDRKAVAS